LIGIQSQDHNPLVGIKEESLMASHEDTLAANNEEYLYLYEYTIEGKYYNWFGYFKNQDKAEKFITFYSAPHIHTLCLRECKNGISWGDLRIPHKRSDWKKMHPEDPE
jgi:hypothetical protein